MPQNRSLERAKLLAGVEPQLVAQRASGIAENIECLDLPAGTVERDRELHAQLLAQRVLGAQRGKLSDHPFVLAEGEPGRQKLLPARESEFLQAARLLGSELGVQRIGERRATPERESSLEEHRGQSIVSLLPLLPPLCEKPREAMAVERIGVEVEPIPRRGGGDGIAAEELAEVGDVELDQLRRRRRCT